MSSGYWIVTLACGHTAPTYVASRRSFWCASCQHYSMAVSAATVDELGVGDE